MSKILANDGISESGKVALEEKGFKVITEKVDQENLIESLTNELTEEPMINKIGAAIEIAEDITSKKPREKKAAGEKKARVVKKKAMKEQEHTTESTPTMPSP